MSDQQPPTPPSPSSGFEPYRAPAYGDVEPDAPTLASPSGPAAGAAAQPGPPTTQPFAAPYGQPGQAGHPGQPHGGSYGSPYPVAPQSSPYQVAPQYVGAYGAPTHPLATTSLVLGVIGILSVLATPVFLVTFVGVLCSPFAIWLGVRARREIRANPLQHGGEGVATGGFVTGIIGVVLGVIGVLLILAFAALIVGVLSSA